MLGNEFKLFEPSLNLKQNYFIEASAGTGKTFTIENIVVRLIQEGISLDQILVVTFTRAATEELKVRIRRTMEEKLLKKELATVDDAKIFTIHGFCFHTLKEHALETGFVLDQKEESASQVAMRTIFKDFLRTELDTGLFHHKQLKRLLKAHQNDYEKLFKEALKPVDGESRGFACALKAIREEVKKLAFEKQALLEELLIHAPKFGKMCDNKKQLKRENAEGLEKFCSLFEGNFEEIFDLPIIKMIPENLLKNKGPYPELLQQLNQQLIPLLEEVSKNEKVLNELRKQFKQFSDHVRQENDLILYDDLLKKMHSCVADEGFCKKVRAGYQAALIDEFQDTDRMQWQIFSSLFLGHLPLYLVGDPKQSIYRFRGADLYTYIEAKEKMGPETWTTLTRNYRSDSGLVSALNCLFSRTPDLIALPRNGQSLTIPKIEAGLSDQQDGKIIFCQSENESALFSFVVQEIERLCRYEAVSYCECAVLVKDHYQAKRFCDQCPLPFVTKKSESLLESEAFPILEDLIQAAYNPRERHAILKAMGGALFRIPLGDLSKRLEEHVELFYRYHKKLQQEGILVFFKHVSENALFSNENLYLDLLQLTEVVAENCSNFEEYLPFLQSLRESDPDVEELKARSKFTSNAVQVMTVHVSKGLEFSHVFPVALMCPHTFKDQEEISEKMRQLYVAVTRAKKRLYLPLSEKENTPISFFLKKALKGEEIHAFVKQHPHFSLAHCEKKDIKFSPVDNRLPSTLNKLTDLAFAPSAIFSYSSLSEKIEPVNFPNLPLGAMPAGTETGIILHRIFENLDFSKKEKELSFFLEAQLKGTLLEPWIKDVEAYVFNALYFPLTGHAGCFCLADVNPSKMRREMQFWYASQHPAGYIKGFVDLFFEHQGYFYIVDWKSNLLEYYASEQLEEVVKRYNYDLQAAIYQTAAKKFLRLFDKEARMGEIFYYFLRGLDIKNRQGVYRYAG
jgi:exodeoxyribonuclease V beta subunit